MLVRSGLKNPLGVARMIVKLEDALRLHGFDIQVSSNMIELAKLKREARGFDPAPMHDHSVCDFSQERSFWMGLKDGSGKVVGLQAFRCDYVDVSLSEWCANYMIGVYMRRNELLVPSHAKPPAGSIGDRLRGWLVYHGELWVDPHVKPANTVDLFAKAGSYISLAKWNPDAIWALTSHRLASRGYMPRFNLPYLERGFLRWSWQPEGIDAVEYLAVAEKAYLEQSVEEDFPSIPVQRPAWPQQQSVSAAPVRRPENSVATVL